MIAHFAVALCLLTGAGADDPSPTPGAPPFLHPLFVDHCVLQRDVPIPIWGWAEPGVRVKVSFLGQSVETTTGPSGRWMVRLGPYPAGGPHTLSVTGPRAVEVANILIGDVWVCSGQSNMEWDVKSTDRAAEEIAAADHPNIRLFKVPRVAALKPLMTVDARWDVCSPATIAEFSAVGYFFGRDIEREVKVPIGLIESAWGGTIAEAWMSPGAVDRVGDFDAQLAQVRDSEQDAGHKAARYDKLLADWWQKSDPGMTAPTPWSDPTLDLTDWKPMTVPGHWEERGLPGFDGIAWLRREVTLPASWAGKPVRISLGPVDDFDTTFLNGTEVGHLEAWFAPRTYSVPAGIAQAGKNVIAVRIFDNQGLGGFGGAAKDLTIALADDSQADPIPLAGEWSSRVAAPLSEIKPAPLREEGGPNRVTVLYNGMIAPIVPFALKGALWYQGESNASRAMQYRRLLPELIRDWRAQFGVGEFPFFVVQLANYMKRLDQPADSSWAELREAQYLTTKALPNVEVALAIDIGEADDIHPRNKQEVGRRLALDALATVYGKPVEYSGPTFKGMETHTNSIRLTFDHVGAGLIIQGGGTKLEGFALAGKDGKFQWADAVIDGNGVVVSSTEVDLPVAVRYAWADNPACNLANKAGLPAVPFRTDMPKPEE